MQAKFISITNLNILEFIINLIFSWNLLARISMESKKQFLAGTEGKQHSLLKREKPAGRSQYNQCYPNDHQSGGQQMLQQTGFSEQERPEDNSE
jgi:hypothetical protein